jgi:hypothetical protein
MVIGGDVRPGQPGASKIVASKIPPDPIEAGLAAATLRCQVAAMQPSH